MRRIGLIGTVLALALAGGSAAAADCATELEDVLDEAPNLDALPPDEALLARRTLRELGYAARQLAADGHEAACIAALDALAKTMTDYQLEVIDPAPAGTIKGAQDQLLPEAALDERDARLVPLTTGNLAFTTRDIVGNSVFTYGGEYAGEFLGLVTGQGGYATHAVIGHGGFWDIFESRAALPIDLVRWDPDRRLFYIPFGEEELEAAPVYDPEAGAWDQGINDDYYASLAE